MVSPLSRHEILRLNISARHRSAKGNEHLHPSAARSLRQLVKHVPIEACPQSEQRMLQLARHCPQDVIGYAATVVKADHEAVKAFAAASFALWHQTPRVIGRGMVEALG